MSTIAAVRSLLVTTLQGIAQSGLDFEFAPGNIKNYLLDYEREELFAEYLIAKVGGEKKVRAWGVMVTAEDMFFSTSNLMERVYRIRIRGYYQMEKEGAGINLLVDHMMRVNQAIGLLSTSLNGLIDYVETVEPPSFDSTAPLDEDIGQVLVGELTLVGRKTAPGVV